MAIIEERIVANGHGGLDPFLFCVHTTGNVGATAENHASLWGRQPDYAVHLVSDWGTCLHTVPYDRLCWQVGNANGYVEGIEICEADNEQDFKAGIDIAAQAVAERLKAHGWGTDKLVTHAWCAQTYGGSDHTDPYPYFDRWGYTWDEFVKLVDAKLNGSGQWMQQDGRWWYKRADGSYPANAWEQINGTWYLFDAEGWMLTGWQARDGAWYYMDGSGAMLTGWQLVGGKWYYLTPSGAMATGWHEENGTWYYLDSDGSMRTGWKQIDGKWYWLNSDGSMAEGEVRQVGDTFYAFDGSGAMQPKAVRLETVDV